MKKLFLVWICLDPCRWTSSLVCSEIRTALLASVLVRGDTDPVMSHLGGSSKIGRIWWIWHCRHQLVCLMLHFPNIGQSVFRSVVHAVFLSDCLWQQCRHESSSCLVQQVVPNHRSESGYNSVIRRVGHEWLKAHLRDDVEVRKVKSKS